MIGKLISHYKILDEIGSGGMGVVYKAQDTKLDRTVALKFLPPQLSLNQEEKKRFIHEAKAAAALSHANIVTIYEINEYEDQTFIAMEYLQGQTVKEKLTSGPLPVTEVLDISIQIARGLQEAHERNIIHRDIKPANIFITPKKEVKILDFGLAKLRGVTKLTKEGTTLGTVAYMSPEQATGDKMDHRSDIWSLGVLLYEMITGQLPFKGEYEQAIMYAIMNEEPEPVTGLRTGVPQELERILVKSLRKDVSERYQYIEELLVDLKQIQKNFSPESKKAKKPIKKKKKPLSKVFVAAIIVALLVILIGGYFLLLHNPEKLDIKKSEGIVLSKWKNSIAVLPFTNISTDKEQEYFCDGMTEEIITKLTTINDLKVISRTSVMRFRNTEKTIKEIGRNLNVKNILEGSVRRSKNRVRITAQLIRVADDAHLWAKNYERKLEDIFSIQDEVSKAIANALKVTLSPETLQAFQKNKPRNMQAYEYYLKGMHIFNTRAIVTRDETDYKTARDMLLKALDLDPESAKLYNGLVYFHALHFILTRSQSDLKMMKVYAEKAVRLNPRSAQGYSGLGLFKALQLNIDDAYPLFKKALAMNPNDPIILYQTVAFHFPLRLYHKALEFCLKSIEIDPLFFPGYMTAGRLELYLGNHKRSELYLKEAHRLVPQQPIVLSLFIQVYLRLNKLDLAEEWLLKLEKMQQETVNTEALRTLLNALKGNKEMVLKSPINNKTDEAYALLGMKDEAIAIIQASVKKNHMMYNYPYLLHCPFYDNLRDDPRFQKIMEKAKTLYEERLKKYGDL